MSVPAYPEYKDSGVAWLEEVPSHWSIGRIKDLFEIRKRIAGELGHDVLSITQSGLKVKDIQSNDGQQAMDYAKYQLVLPGDFAMNHMDLLTGWIDVSTRHGVTSPDYRVFAARHENANVAQFFLYVFQMAYSRRQFYPFGQGSSQFGRWRLPTDAFYAFPIPLPAREEQAMIATFLDRETAKIDGLVAEQERLIALLKEKRQAVISHAVTKGLNPNAPLKDSGIEWLGQIPAHWEVSKVKFGTSHVIDCLHITPTYDGELLYPAIRTADVDRGVLLLDQARLVSQEIYDERIQRLRPLAGDILYSREGERFGMAALVPTDIDLCLGQRMMMFRVTSDYYPAFVMWAFNSDSVYQQVISDIGGATSPHVNISDVINFSIPCPPRSEQSSIADLVSERTAGMDALLTEAQSAIALLQERRAALISAAVTGKIDVRRTASQNNVISITQARDQRALPALRSVVGAYVIHALGAKGRMAVMKGAFLAEAHAGLREIGGRYERNAAGPYDRSLISTLESGAQDLCGIQANEAKVKDGAVSYQMPSGFLLPASELLGLVGANKAKDFQAMLSYLADINREGVEAVATLYAVWNDLLASGKSAADDVICYGVLSEWHEEKAKKFKRADLDHWLAWMRRNGFVPNGSAPRTDHQGSLFS